MLLIEVRHVENFLIGDGRFYGDKSLFSGYIIVKRTYVCFIKSMIKLSSFINN